MCKFISAIVMKSGDLICDPEHTDNHEDLMIFANIRDNYLQLGRFARIEFTPPDDKDIADVSAWNLHVDEDETPVWFDSVVVRSKMEALARRMIISDERKLLLGGCWILVGEANVKTVKSARIFTMRDSSRVNTMRDSSQVNTMRDSSQVNTMLDSSQVNMMLDSSQVNTMLDSSRVNTMLDSSRVNTMRDSSRVEEKS